MASALEAVDAALEAIRSREGEQGDFEAARALERGLGSRHEAAAGLVRDIAKAIYNRESLTLASLADRYGMSAQRMHQLVRGQRGNKGKRKDDGDA